MRGTAEFADVVPAEIFKDIKVRVGKIDTCIDDRDSDILVCGYVCNGSDAEESGLTSSSTGCSLDAVDDNGSLIPALFALFVAVCAFFGFKKVRN